jgi:hypothetical protein
LFFIRLSRERASCFGLLAAAAIPQHLEDALLSSQVSAAQDHICEQTNCRLIVKHVSKTFVSFVLLHSLENRAAECEGLTYLSLDGGCS